MKKLPFRKKKEERICELIRNDTPVREIASIVHVSFSEIKRVKRKYFDDEDDNPTEERKRSQALTMIDIGKSDFEIAIELELDSKEILEIRKEYLRLKSQDEILTLYQALGNSVKDFVDLFHQMQEEGLTVDEAVEALEKYHLFKLMTQEYETLAKKLRPLREEVEKLKLERMKLAEEVQALKEMRDEYYAQFEGISLEKLFPVTESNSVDSNVNKTPHYRRIKKKRIRKGTSNGIQK